MNENIDIFDKQANNSDFINDDIEIIDVFDENKNELVSVDDFKFFNQNYMKLNYSDGSVRVFLNNSGILGKSLFNGISDGNKTELFFSSINGSDITEVNVFYFSNHVGWDSNASFINSVYPNKNILFIPSCGVYVLKKSGYDDLLVYVNNFKIIPVDLIDNLVQDNLNDYEEIGDDSKNFQKSLSTPIGRAFSDESGFMTFLFVIFLTGISVGMVSMIFLNFIA